MKSNFLNELKEMQLHNLFDSSLSISFLQLLINLETLSIRQSSKLWEWFPALKPLSKLRVLDIHCSRKCSLIPPTDTLCWLVEHRLTAVWIDVNFPSYTIYDICSPTDVLVDSVLKSALRSNTITKLVLPNVSRGTMAGVHSILLHCPSLTLLELKRTRLGYDGILYICSALRNNTTLKKLVVLDHLELPEYKSNYSRNLSYFTSMEGVPLPTKTTCTDFLLELNKILKDNSTLEAMKIQSGLFLLLSVSAGKYEEDCQWTGLGPLQQFNVGAVASGMSPNLRRSFSLSDLTRPQTQLFWGINLPGLKPYLKKEMNLFSKRKEESKKLFSGPSFTAPDTQVLQSFSGLDPRLKKCLEIIISM